jgi:hypothetical protein
MNTIPIKQVELFGIRALRFALGASLLVFGLRAFLDGRARDDALPIPSSMISGKELPGVAYLAGAAALAAANSADGEAHIAQGEALLWAGTKPEREVTTFEEALTHDPTSVRGWTLLSLSSVKSSPSLAAAALTQAVVLAPADYWTLEMRCHAASLLWNRLDSDTKQAVLEQVRLLWDTPSLRPAILTLLTSVSGAALVTEAFRTRQADLVQINRWAARAQLVGKP